MCGVSKKEAATAPAFCDDRQQTRGVAPLLRCLLCVEAVLFALFTVSMACEDIPYMLQGHTYIDSLKAKRGAQGGPSRRPRTGWDVDDAEELMFGGLDSMRPKPRLSWDKRRENLRKVCAGDSE